MNRTHRLTFPIDAQTARTLRAGDFVVLDGEITITAGLPTHDRILEYLRAGKPFPYDLRGKSLMHLGSYSRDTDGDFEVLYMNPTTSTRFNAVMPPIIRALDLHAVGGKGGLDAECVKAMQETGCVYLSFLGGGCTLHSRAMREVVSVEWDDFIAHYRLTTVRVEALGPTTVAIDAHGVSLYDNLTRDAQARMPDLLAGLAARRGGA